MTAADLPPRIKALEARFRQIGDEQMRDLPLYNENLVVEAVGFHEFEGTWLGILITPWFMNVMRLPLGKEDWRPNEVGKREPIMLPSGEFPMMIGGDPEVGHYLSRSLHSPMNGFHDPALARATAEKALERLLTEPEPEEPEEHKADDGPDMSRRGFLRGGFTGKAKT